MQFLFLRTIAPVEILVGAERRRALQFVVVDVEFVGLEPGAVAKPAPRQRQQIGADAEEAAETQTRRRTPCRRSCRSSAVRYGRSCRRSAAAPRCLRHDRSRSTDVVCVMTSIAIAPSTHEWRDQRASGPVPALRQNVAQKQQPSFPFGKDGCLTRWLVARRRVREESVSSGSRSAAPRATSWCCSTSWCCRSSCRSVDDELLAASCSDCRNCCSRSLAEGPARGAR